MNQQDTQAGPSSSNNNSSSTKSNNSLEFPKTEDMEHKTHCDNCFNIDKCLRLKSMRNSRPETFVSCPIIFCRFSCSKQFHQCKQDEHELLCPNVRVPCINKEFGCPVVLERRLKAKHLPKCPASVIACTMEWNRWPLPPGKCQPFAMDASQLDIASTLRDQQIVTEWKQKLPSSLRNTLRCYHNERHPVMPLGVSGNRIPKCITTQATLEKESSDFSESTESDHDESSDSPWGAKKSPPGLQESVCNKLKTIKIDRSSDQGPINRNNAEKVLEVKENGKEDNSDEFHSCSSAVDDDEDSSCGGYVLEKDANAAAQDEKSLSNNSKLKNVNLNIVLEVITRYQIKPDSMYTFMCAREFRRDEYSDHFSNIHLGIHTQLNGWLFARCPLANQGCSFGTERMFPNDNNYRIVFNDILNAFCFTQKMLPTGDKDNDTQDYFSSLPFELLIHMTKYLDPLSLNSLSMTSTLFREVCECVIVERGLVVFQWEKHPTLKRWEVVEKKWFFSTSFSPIRKWSFADVGVISNHMKTCPCFERNVQTEPFRYPVDVNQL